MKLKYYLRGLGIGMIVTTIILTICFSNRAAELSDEEIIARATQLGMIMSKEREDAAAKADGQTAEELLDAALGENTEFAEADEARTEELGEAATYLPEYTDTYQLVVKSGDVCRLICENLEENGVIEDAEALRAYLSQCGYANSIDIGVYEIPYGLSMEEVAESIMAGPIRR